MTPFYRSSAILLFYLLFLPCLRLIVTNITITTTTAPTLSPTNSYNTLHQHGNICCRWSADPPNHGNGSTHTLRRSNTAAENRLSGGLVCTFVRAHTDSFFLWKLKTDRLTLISMFKYAHSLSHSRTHTTHTCTHIHTHTHTHTHTHAHTHTRTHTHTHTHTQAMDRNHQGVISFREMQESLEIAQVRWLFI